MDHGDISVESIEYCRAGLARLDALLQQLNFFQAAGLERRELSHSRFLQFLLTPTANHGLGASFLKQFLLRALRESASQQFMSELSSSSLAYARVRREEDDIDLLIIDEYLGLGVIVENKIDAPEHKNQLERYWSLLRQKFPRLKYRFGVFLSPNLRPASHPQYTAFSYAELAEILHREAAAAGLKPETDAGVIIKHYIALIRREFMDNAPAAELVWELWQKHRPTMDFITENRPTTQITTILSELLASTPCERESARRGPKGPKKLAFVLRGWREHRQFQDPARNSHYRSALLFWFEVEENFVRLRLAGWEGQPGLSQYLENLRRSNDFFASHQITREDGWMLLWSKQFLNEQDLRMTRDKVFRKLQDRWFAFWRNDVPKIERAIGSLPLLRSSNK